MMFRLSLLLSIILSIPLEAKSIHVLVALCDNQSQGIVPVPKQLGNGDLPKENLYWGALYGIKTFFKKSSNWKLQQNFKPKSRIILERCIFKSKDGQHILIADAYRGREIQKTIQDFFYCIGHGQKPQHFLDHNLYNIGPKADLVAYIGHNGLMDFKLQSQPPRKQKHRPDTIVLACQSRNYFEKTIRSLKSKPVLLTNGFMAPEAYTLEAAIKAWLSRASPQKIEEVAAKAYHQYQSCGLRAAHRLFKSPKTQRF